ncbi:MAG: hypothetical protein WCF33_18595 [Pseudonocardiaceae bacterium]
MKEEADEPVEVVRRGYIDVSKVRIRRACHLVPDATFICADTTAVELPSESSDAVVRSTR